MIDRTIFDTMFEKISMGVFIADKDGYYKYVNPMACKMTGYDINELIGKNKMDLVPEENREEAENDFKQLKNGVEKSKKIFCRVKSGEIRHWGLKTIKVSDEIYVSITDDITEYEKAVSDSIKYLNRLKLAGETGKVGSWEFDIEKNEIWRSAEAARQFTGKSVEDMCTMDDLLKCFEDKEILKKTLKKIVEKGENTSGEIVIYAEDGVRRVLKAYMSAIDKDGGDKKIIGATVEITELSQIQNQICEEKNRLREYLDIAEVIMLVLDNNGFVKMINRKGCDVLGYKKEDILGKSWVDEFVPSYVKEKVKEILSNNIFNEKEAGEISENPIITKDGSIRIIRWKNTMLKDSEDIIIGSLSSGEDITEKIQIEKALANSEASLKKAEILTKSGHFEKDFETGTGKWSDGMYILLGYEPQSFEITHESDIKIFTKPSYEKLENAYYEAMRKKGEFEIEIEANSKNGEKTILRIIGVVENDGKKVCKVLATCQDITNSKEHLENIEYISYHDQLTGLYNRRFLEEEFNRLDVQRNYPLAVVMADVNGLKLVNDTFGHSEGDQMLINTANVLKKAVRKDDIIARIGGDEFMILLPRIGKQDVGKLIDRVLSYCKEFQSTMLPLSVSLGAAIKTKEDIKSEELFKKAEDNMYRSKLHEAGSRRSEAIKIISDTLYEKNRNEEAHAENASEISVLIGMALGLPRQQLNELKTLGLIHDIGKIAVQQDCLKKKGALTPEEFKDIKKHPEAGFRILSTSNDMADLAEHVLCHHERWDGKGYPRGIQGEEIPYMARIIAIAEAYDAMTNKKSYRRQISRKKAYIEIRKNAGSQFDPNLSKVFLQGVWPDLI